MIYGIIPARKGSETIPRKNFQIFCGRPLFEWTVDASTQSVYVDQTILSTDDLGVQDHVHKLGINIHKRAEHLSGPHIHAVHVVLDVIEEYGIKDNDIVLMLLPTSPLRTSHHVDLAMRTLNDTTDAPSVIGVYSSGLPQNYRRISFNQLVPIVGGEMNVQRQDVDPLYRVNGSIFGARVGELKREKTFHMKGAIPFIMNKEDSLDINTWDDFAHAEKIMQDRLEVDHLTGKADEI